MEKLWASYSRHAGACCNWYSAWLHHGGRIPAAHRQSPVPLPSPAPPHRSWRREKKVSIMSDVACFCGCLFSFNGARGGLSQVRKGRECNGRPGARTPRTHPAGASGTGHERGRTNASSLPGTGRSRRPARHRARRGRHSSRALRASDRRHSSIASPVTLSDWGWPTVSCVTASCDGQPGRLGELPANLVEKQSGGPLTGPDGAFHVAEMIHLRVLASEEQSTLERLVQLFADRKDLTDSRRGIAGLDEWLP